MIPRPKLAVHMPTGARAGRDRSPAAATAGRALPADPPTDYDRPMDDDDLLARQAVLQAEAHAVLADLDLLALLAGAGRPALTGSCAMGVMVRRDIDVTTLCPSLDTEPVFSVGRALAAHPRVHRLAFRNDTGRWNVDPAYPDGLYWGVAYRADDGADWNLDLWFLREGTTQFDLEHLETLLPRLTPETRAAILRVKESLAGSPAYGREIHGYDVYAAVLDGGARTPDEFAAWAAAQGRDAQG